MSQLDQKEDISDPLQTKTRPVTNTQQLYNTSSSDEALTFFSKTFISERRPRSNSSEVECHKQGTTLVTRTTDTLQKIFEIMAVESILGLPIIDSDNNDVCIGIIDQSIICRYLFTVVLPQCMNNATVTDKPTVESLQRCLTADCCTRFNDIISKTTARQMWDWCQQQCAKECAKSPRTAFSSSLIIPEGFNLLFAMQLLSNNGVRRLVTVDNDNRVTGFYSSSMAISDIRQNAHQLRAFTSRSVQSCLSLLATTARTSKNNVEVSPCNVLSLPITATAYEAFNLMLQHNVSGIALLGDDGKLTGTLSMRDLRGCGRKLEHIDRLCLTLKEFKSIVLANCSALAPSTHWASSSTVPSGARYVTLEEGSMRDIVLALSDGLLQRVFIMNKYNDLVGVITLCDVIKILLSTLGLYEFCEQCETNE